MDELLTKDNIYYRDLARSIAEQYVRPIAAELDRTGEYPWSVINALKEAGLMGMWIPKEYGGKSSGLLNLCIVCRRDLAGLRRHRLHLRRKRAWFVSNRSSAGTEEQKKKYLPDIAAGKNLIAFALSEKDRGLGRRRYEGAGAEATAITTSSTATRSGRPTARRRTYSPCLRR